MKRIKKSWFLLLAVALFAASAWADVVHVVYQTLAGDTVATIAETTLETGCDYVTVSAPALDGFIFTHWSSSESDPIVVRDAWGRALDAARFTLYQDVTLTAHYVAATLDSDGDGIPDGHELYWYGNLDQNADSDTDGDGFTFAEELANGTNPLMAESRDEGPIAYAGDALWLYNPNGYAPYTIRSEPEGALFETVSDYVRPGTTITSLTGDPSATAFAYWTLNGVRQCDDWGRSLDSFAITMPSNAVELVAVSCTTVEDKWKLYWYGTTDIAMDSDTDGDGSTFAEEIANGTNPLMAERHEEGPVTYVDDALWLYNPFCLQPYTLASDPEGALFATTSVYVRAGTIVTGYAGDPNATEFAYWTMNGAAQRDAWGRALDAVTFTMPSNSVTLVAMSCADAAMRHSLYWYGNTTTAMDSDTDGDGFTFAEEIANGTNPLMAERHAEGPVTYADADEAEMNLQPFDPATGAVVGEVFEEIFTSPYAGNAATSATFGANARPVVADVNGDGLFDLVVLYDGGHAVYVNGGSDGNPQFTRDDSVSTNGLDLVQGTVALLDGLTLDVTPSGATGVAFGDVDGDGVTDLLVSDDEGRIWFYKGTKRAEETTGTETDSAGASAGEASLGSLESLSSLSFTLQHKVWAGSRAGFAKGLTIALVDWDGDGDLDCVCGTSDGKLMLLVDPQIGRPTNVTATPGVDSVVLAWDPNGNSRVRGYGVYRGAAADGEFANLATASLPRYRDRVDASGDYWYRVTSLTRFYRAGNSTPTEAESRPTDAVRAEVGKVALSVRDAAAFAGQEAEVLVCVDNSMGLSGKGLSLSVAYDPDVLTPKRVEATGLSESLDASFSADAGTLTVTSTSGFVAAGAGKLFALVFDVAESASGTTAVSVVAATLPSVRGGTAGVDLPVVGSVAIEAFAPPDPPEVALAFGSTNVTALSSFEVPVYLVSDVALDRAATSFDLVCDADVLSFSELRFGEGFSGAEGDTPGVLAVSGADGETPAGTNLLGTVRLTAADVAERTFTTLAATNAATRSAAGVASAGFALTVAEIGVFPSADSGEDGGGEGDLDPSRYGYSLASFYLGNASGRTGETVEVPLRVRPWRDVTWDGFVAKVVYDKRFVEPVGVTGLKGEFTWEAADGVLTIRGAGGVLKARRWLIFAEIHEVLRVRFRLLEQYAATATRVDFAAGADAVSLSLAEGGRALTPIRVGGVIAIRFERPKDDPSAVGRHFRGDVDGDGRLTRRDLERLDELLRGDGPHRGGRDGGGRRSAATADEIRAGDYNGNGRLDNGDAQLMREDFRRKGITR